MKKTRTVLCYGDSNTYGAIPTLSRKGYRYTSDQRWTGILARQLGKEWTVIEEGLPGRTTVHSDPIEGRHKNGAAFLPACLESHTPIDLVTIMLGTNDLKARFSVGPTDIARSIEVLLKCVQQSEAGPGGLPPHVLVITPPPLFDVGIASDVFAGGMEKSTALAAEVAAICEHHHVAHFDAGSIIESSSIDGVHLDVDAHQAIGLAIASLVTEVVST